MGGSFACPECDQAIRLRGLTPGREVVCPACATLIEVPYLPRANPAQSRREVRPEIRRGGRGSWQRGMSRGAKRRLRWGLALGAVLGVALVTWWSVGRIEARARSNQERVLAELIAASDRAEAAHNPVASFREIEAALSQARKIDPPGSTRLRDLIERRNRSALGEIQARLAALDRLRIDQGVGEALILLERVDHDPALAPLADEVAARLESVRTRQADADRDQARIALEAGRGIEAFEAAARGFERAEQLTDPRTTTRIQGETKALLVAAVERFGATIPERNEPNAPGSIHAFAGAIWAESLRSRGYLLKSDKSAWDEVWTDHAPYQASMTLDESPEGLYLQSENRATQIDGRFRLSSRGQSVWETRIFARTRAPIPDLPAFLAGRLATASRRDPEIEQRLRDDARASFRAQAARNFRGLPAPAPLATDSTTTNPLPGVPGSGEAKRPS